jgi:Ca2+-binding RTX toxin-like protein
VIAPGVTVWNDFTGAGDAALVDVTFTGDVVLNYGGILNSFADGVLFKTGAAGTIVNEAGGSISGTTGVQLDSVGADTSFLNLASVTAIGGSGGGVVLSGTTGSAIIDNRGFIYDLSATGLEDGSGIVDEATGNRNIIENVGTIDGLIGVKVDTGSGLVTIMTNSGTIRGTPWAIVVVQGTINLDNSGSLAGGGIESISPDGNDVVVNSGHIGGQVALGAGNDLFTGTGGSSGEVFGQDGNDVLVGGSGPDKLSGGAGNDTLTGGPGKDQFIFDAALNASTNVDHITDFDLVHDQIALSHTMFAGIGPVGMLGGAKFYAGAAAHDATDRIIYNPANGHLSYDSDGNGPHHAVLFATLAEHLILHGVNLLVI